MPQMVNAIVKEIGLRNENAAQPIETIYFGGGTPGILPTAEIKKILTALQSHYSILPTAEITLEANPDDMTLQKLQELFDLGINRLSVGTQSFFEEDLVYMNRSHDANAAKQCILDAQKVGFANLSLDLIYGFPLLTNQKWQQNVQTALGLGVTHLSCYAMTVEPNTALAHKIKKQTEKPMIAEESAAQFTQLTQWLQLQNWRHYEISNCAKPGHEAIHNTNYWLGNRYDGYGPSAHSFDGLNIRSWNIAHNVDYIKSIENNILPSEQEILTPVQHTNEYIMTSLRMDTGTSLQKLEANCSALQWKECLLTIKKHANMWRVFNNYLVLTAEGKLFADYLASELFL